MNICSTAKQGDSVAGHAYICDCDVIHEEAVGDVRSKLQSKDGDIQLASLFKLFGEGTRGRSCAIHSRTIM